MDKTTIINLIKANIKPNGMMEITGQVLQDVLVRMINDSVANLGDLLDVAISDPKEGEVITYKGGKWVNGSTAGASYQVMTQAVYDQAYKAGTLEDKMLYIIID